ncbi:MAG: helix-turn-helix domain-containing protein [Deltaproteobacteria bacterium]|nr:helix-turn-helix domain-containing protein [Deltaproteobacteria bacterium]
MAKKDQYLTSGEFASKAGITTSSVTKLIRDGKIKAEKKSGKWMISPDQLNAKAVQDSVKPGKKTAAKKTGNSAGKKTTVNKPAPTQQDKPAKAKTTAGKMYTVAEFAGMTYLTEFGVQEWLKQGRLSGRQAASEDWQVDAANLEVPDIKRLVR